MNVKMRKLVEEEIGMKLVSEALKAGYTISVQPDIYNPNYWELEKSTDKNKIKEVLFSGDDTYLGFYLKDDQELPLGWAKLIFGNYGYDVISDYSTNIEHIMPEVNKLIDKYSD